ncbi:MAG: hypothetical protein DDT35_00597 [Firmicutes bacterium]|nr:hypothetical protein [Bacillota bacterium]
MDEAAVGQLLVANEVLGGMARNLQAAVTDIEHSPTGVSVAAVHKARQIADECRQGLLSLSERALHLAHLGAPQGRVIGKIPSFNLTVLQ